MKKFDFTKIATLTLANSVGGVAGVELDNLSSKLPLPKPIFQLGKIAVAIAASFFLPKQQMVMDASAGLIGQSAAELYKTVTKRGQIGDADLISGDDTVFVNENGVRSDGNGNPLVIEGIGYLDADGNVVNEDGSPINGIGEMAENSLVS